MHSAFASKHMDTICSHAAWYSTTSYVFMTGYKIPPVRKPTNRIKWTWRESTFCTTGLHISLHLKTQAATESVTVR